MDVFQQHMTEDVLTVLKIYFASSSFCEHGAYFAALCFDGEWNIQTFTHKFSE